MTKQIQQPIVVLKLDANGHTDTLGATSNSGSCTCCHIDNETRPLAVQIVINLVIVVIVAVPAVGGGVTVASVLAVFLLLMSLLLLFPTLLLQCLPSMMLTMPLMLLLENHQLNDKQFCLH